MKEIIVVGFAGGGGSCEGIKMALGRSPDVAINHDEAAVAMHTANHPDTLHYCQNIWQAVPSEVLRAVMVKQGLPQMPKIGLAWFSPDCKHFSKAKGGKPVSKNIRDLAWVILAWAKLPPEQRPREIIIENVEEFLDWGPLLPNGQPDPKRKGLYFQKFVRPFKQAGYKMEHRFIVAARKGAPTTRKRLYIIFRNDGLPIIWPEDTHDKPTSPAVISGKRKPWRTAAENIDWSIPCPSVFATAAEIKEQYGIRAIRPLASNTLGRLARGTFRYVIDSPNPFIVPITHTGDARVHGIDEPLRTVTTAPRGEHALVTPFVTKFNRGATGHAIDEPLHTITAAHSTTHPGGAVPLGLVTPFLARQFGASVGSAADEPAPTVMPNGGGKTALITPFLAGVGSRAGQSPERPINGPAPTITATKRGQHAVIAPTLIQTGYGERKGQAPRCLDLHQPLGTCVDGGKHAVVAAFLAQHNTDMVGHDAREPLSTIVQKGCTQAVVSAGLLNLKGSKRRQSAVEDPAPTQCAGGWHIAESRAFLTKFHRDGGQHADCNEPMHTVPCRDSFGLASADLAEVPLTEAQLARARQVADLLRSYGYWDEREFVTIGDWIMIDIGMRMLTPRELFNCQGFRRDYIIDRGLFADGWKPLTKTDQIRMCGNAVCPDVAEALVSANYIELEVNERGVPEFALEAAE